MNEQEYIRSFRFGPLTTETPVPEETTVWFNHYPELRLLMEKWNTVFPEDARGVQLAIEEIALMPRLSTLAVGLLINHIVSRMPEGQAYVNIGTWYGFTHCASFPGNADRHCIGVDNFSEFTGPRAQCVAAVEKYKQSPLHRFFDMDYREYFKEHTLPIGFYYYDGEHSYEHQLQGLEMAVPFLAEGAVIMVDDTNWEAPRRATLDFMARYPGRYEVIADIRTACNHHPTWWNGLMLLRRIS